LAETLTESFCERCGTRYEFKAPTRLNPLRKTRGLFGGLKNYLTSQDALGDAIGDAMRSEEESLASAQLEAFHETFNFCINCRQYTCLNCWNDADGRCRTCAPIAGTDDLAERLAASLASAAPVPTPSSPLPDLGAAIPLNGGSAADSSSAGAWPTSDLSEPVQAASTEAWPVEDQTWPATEVEPQLELEPVVAAFEPEAAVAEVEPEAEFEPVVAEVEPVVAEVEPEPELEPVVAEVEPVVAEVEPEPDFEPVVAAFEPEAAVAEVEPEPESEPVVAEVEPEPEFEPVVAEVEPEPEPEAIAAELDAWGEALSSDDSQEPRAAETDLPPLRVVSWDDDLPHVVAQVEVEPEPEPEPMVAEVEPEPEPIVAEVEPEPELPRAPRIAPISETILRLPPRHTPPPAPAPAPVQREEQAAAQESPEVAARRAQLDLLGLGDPGEGPVAPVRPAVLPYRSRGAAAALPPATDAGFWEASAREVAGSIGGQIGVQSCGQCGLSLSANARFCRRCGARQAQSA
jgi:hypothetical protein